MSWLLIAVAVGGCDILGSRESEADESVRNELYALGPPRVDRPGIEQQFALISE
jgi:hypothetical protein